MGKKDEVEEYSYNGTFEISSRSSYKKTTQVPDERGLEETNKLLEELIVDKEGSIRISPAGIDSFSGFREDAAEHNSSLGVGDRRK